MHTHHLAGCAVAIAAAVTVFGVTGGSIGGLGLVLAALVCPLAMAAVMWFLLGSPRPIERRPARADAEEVVR